MLLETLNAIQTHGMSMVATVTGVAHPNSGVQNMKGTARMTLTASPDWFAAAKTVQKISVLVIVLTVVNSSLTYLIQACLQLIFQYDIAFLI